MPEDSKRDRIFRATKDLLMEHGLLSVQTRAVTERAGVGTGLLNHYFTWPDLRAAAWDAIFAEVAAEMRHPGESPVEALDRFFAESFCAEARPLWRLWVEAEGLADRDEGMARAMRLARSRLRDALTDILAGGVAMSSWHLAAPRVTALRLEAMRDGLTGLLLVADAELDSIGAEGHLRAVFWQET